MKLPLDWLLIYSGKCYNQVDPNIYKKNREQYKLLKLKCNLSQIAFFYIIIIIIIIIFLSSSVLLDSIYKQFRYFYTTFFPIYFCIIFLIRFVIKKSINKSSMVKLSAEQKGTKYI